MSRLYGGSGLGLVISRRLAERLGGRMWVESDLGRGSTFSFTIRARTVSGPLPEPSGELQSEGPMADRYPLRILVAEDNSVNQKVVLLMLERLGYRADVAGDGREALEALRRQRYDVVLMDLQMPEMDGLEATRRIREAPPLGERPWIVAVSASVLQEQQEACRAAGMDDFVAKPIDYPHLREALQRAGTARAGGARPAAPEAHLPVGEGFSTPRETPLRLDRSRLDGLRKLEQVSGRSVVPEIVDSFLAEAPRRLARIREALAQADAKEVAFWAHSLKGSSSQIGAGRLAALSLDLEKRGKGGSLEGADPLLEELERELAELTPELREEGAKAPS
jgi:CheY-like chemotaxis protein/HPt (histidine-containing phosphotransfer) domain-containing protein